MRIFGFRLLNFYTRPGSDSIIFVETTVWPQYSLVRVLIVDQNCGA